MRWFKVQGLYLTQKDTRNHLYFSFLWFFNLNFILNTGKCNKWQQLMMRSLPNHFVCTANKIKWSCLDWFSKKPKYAGEKAKLAKEANQTEILYDFEAPGGGGDKRRNSFVTVIEKHSENSKKNYENTLENRNLKSGNLIFPLNLNIDCVICNGNFRDISIGHLNLSYFLFALSDPSHFLSVLVRNYI